MLCNNHFVLMLLCYHGILPFFFRPARVYRRRRDSVKDRKTLEWAMRGCAILGFADVHKLCKNRGTILDLSLPKMFLKHIIPLHLLWWLESRNRSTILFSYQTIFLSLTFQPVTVFDNVCLCWWLNFIISLIFGLKLAKLIHFLDCFFAYFMVLWKMK